MNGGQVGYTDDGLVFVMFLSQIEGKPTQTVIQWTPEQAKAMSQAILNAANSAEQTRGAKN